MSCAALTIMILLSSMRMPLSLRSWCPSDWTWRLMGRSCVMLSPGTWTVNCLEWLLGNILNPNLFKYLQCYAPHYKSSLKFSPNREAHDSRDVCWNPVWWSGPEPADLCSCHCFSHQTADRVLPYRQYTGWADGPESHHQGSMKFNTAL